ncbi:MAG: hypothetical protein PF638_04750 [Candidatus Delongbacteria bacterium]|jgi:hypothetical protein|nr:hypothetical protein [Candidatus Delongbacteria bacterium]
MNLIKLEEKMDYIFNHMELYMDKLVHHADKALDALSKAPDYTLKTFMNFIESITDSIYELLNKDTSIARLLRYGSLPWSIIIPKGYKYFFSNQFNKALLFVPGVHMIKAKVGGGKSLTSFVLAELYLEETGRGSYFTSPVEKPQVTDDGNWLYVYHRVIDPSDYYKDGKKIKNYNSEKYKIFHKDERLITFNRRENKSSEYNKKFIPEQRDEVLMRHQGIERIYKYSQSPKLDSQEMELLTYMHEVETVKTIPTKRWLESGRFDYIPVKLKFTTYELQFNFGDSSMKRKKIGSCTLPVPFEILKRFDTHAESKRYAGLPVDYK